MKHKYLSVNISNSVIKVCDSAYYDDMLIVDANLEIADGILEIKGFEVKFKFIADFDRHWIDNPEIYSEGQVKYAYRHFLDRIDKLKSPYLDNGWVQLKKREPITIKMSHWKIIE